MQISAFLPIYNRYNQQQNSLQYNKYTNLAPLRQDTVSFGAAKKPTEEVKKDMEQGEIKTITHKMARELHEDAKPSQKYLQRQLNDILGDLVRPMSGKGSQSNPIDIIQFRKDGPKSPESIREKAGSLKTYTYEEVQENMRDICGARIVMADSSMKNVDTVIERLTEAVKDDKLKIIEIENYRPDPEYDSNGAVTKSYDYASPRSLIKLKNECEKKGLEVRKADKPLPSGYMAIHLTVKLPNGFYGEIQIMGADVERLKEVEDKYYKVKCGKHLEKKYASVEKMLAPLANKNNVDTRLAYNKYATRAYIYQRQKEPPKGKFKDTGFLPIPEDLEYLPPQFDFNYINNELIKCDMKASKKKSQ